MKKFKRTATIGHIYSTSWSPFYAYYMFFLRSGSHESNASNGVGIGVETKKLWPFEENHIKLCENFAAAKPPPSTRVPLHKLKLHFPSYEPRYEITFKLPNKLQIISKLQKHLQVMKSQIQLVKSKFKLGKWTIQTCESTCKIHLCKLRYLQPT